MAEIHECATYSEVDDNNGLNRKRILVIGETGKGKSSLIKGVGAVGANGNKPVTEIGSKGGTQKCELFWTDDYAFTDTCGLGEMQNETEAVNDAYQKLIDMFHISRDGFHLALYIVNDVRYSASNTRTFRAYTSLLDEKDIPCALICTKSHNNAGKSIDKDTMADWAKLYEFVDGVYVDFSDIESITDPDDRAYSEKIAKRSNEALKKILDRYGGMTVALYGENNWKTDFLVLWNHVCLKLGFTVLLYTKENIVKMLEACDYGRKKAQIRSAQLYNRLHEKIE